MRTARITKVVLLVLAGALLFWLGRWSYSRNVIVYKNQGYPVAAHLDEPISGLSLAEYSSLLTELRAGLTNEAFGHMEFLLDGAVLGAMSRRPHLPPSGKEQLDKVLSWAARYREEYPRPIDTVDVPTRIEGTQSVADPQLDVFPRLDKGRQMIVDRQLEVDRYLEQFRLQNRTN